MSENAIESSAAPEAAKISKADVLEIVIAIFLAVTALATAWASWVGSLHGGNMSTNYTKSNNLAAEGNAMWNEASQLLCLIFPNPLPAAPNMGRLVLFIHLPKCPCLWYNSRNRGISSPHSRMGREKKSCERENGSKF